MKRCLLFIIVLFIIGFVWVSNPFSESTEEVIVSDSVQQIINEKKNTEPQNQDEEDLSIIEETQDEVVEQETQAPKALSVPGQVLLDVPFIVQAPHANWDLPYKEACEEASLLMAHHFYQGDVDFSQDEMKTAIDGIITWGDQTFGAFDTSAENSARYLTERMGYSPKDVTVVYDFTINDIKALISEGIPVIVPAAGRELGNKFFQDPGPLYHMLVITGYTDDQFITNDPGTRNGEGYKYDQDILFAAIHDLTPNLENITEGKKAMIVLNPQP